MYFIIYCVAVKLTGNPVNFMAGVVVAFTEHCNATSGGCGCYEMLSVGSVARYSLWMFFFLFHALGLLAI